MSASSPGPASTCRTLCSVAGPTKQGRNIVKYIVVVVVVYHWNHMQDALCSQSGEGVEACTPCQLTTVTWAGPECTSRTRLWNASLADSSAGGNHSNPCHTNQAEPFLKGYHQRDVIGSWSTIAHQPWHLWVSGCYIRLCLHPLLNIMPFIQQKIHWQRKV